MEFNLQTGIRYNMELIVSNNETASFYGSGNIDVYATPAMIALMENTSKNCVQGELPEGFTTVGVEINVKHIKATPVGMKVRSEAALAKVEGKRLFFKVEAFDEKGKIGEGTHTRYIINSEEFMKRIRG